MAEKWRNEQNMNAMSGSEMMMTRMEKSLGEDFLKDFQIILSRPSLHELEEDKIRILWCHDLPDDPQIADPKQKNTLADGGWRKYHRIVFVSHWQQQRFIERFHIPWERTVVLKNAIVPIDIDLQAKFESKNDQSVNLVYSTTPHRGLGVLVPVFKRLAEQDELIHLHVFSSFKIYGWEETDKQFEPLYNDIREHPQMTYYGSVPNDELRKHLTTMDIYAYPSMWVETSCVSLIEAMSAGLFCIHPNLGALYETASNWTFMYNWVKDPNQHATFFHTMLDQAIEASRENSPALQVKLQGQKSYTDLFYNWDAREAEWRMFLNSLRGLPREFEKAGADQSVFKYSV